MRVDPALTAHTAGVMLDAAASLACPGCPAASTLDADSAFGTLAASPGIARAHRECHDALETLLARLGQLLEGDGDRLYHLAFAYRALGQRAAKRLGEVGPGGAW